jgi:hypothetical protein
MCENLVHFLPQGVINITVLGSTEMPQQTCNNMPRRSHIASSAEVHSNIALSSALLVYIGVGCEPGRREGASGGTRKHYSLYAKLKEKYYFVINII